jgi:DNA-directed RNA polymerase subunit beta
MSQTDGNGKVGGNGSMGNGNGLGGGPRPLGLGQPAAPEDLPLREFHGRRTYPVPDLVELQTGAYQAFLQEDVTPDGRERQGLEGVMQEVFPIPSYDGTMELQYLGYELGSPRYTPDECRELKLTYGRPFKIRVRLQKESPVEEDVYLGEIPIMLGGGEFIVNGTERVIVTQLHRSPGVDFSVETHASDRKLHSCWVIPERGSWIELNVTKKDILAVRIDQSGKFPATGLLRAMHEGYSTHTEILRCFYPTRQVSTGARNWKKSIIGKHAAAWIYDVETGEEILDPTSAENIITDDVLERIANSKVRSVVLEHIVDGEREKEYEEVITRGREKEKYGVKESHDDVVEVLTAVDDQLVLTTLREDTTESHDEALLRIYARLRPGNPPQVKKAKELFLEKFSDESRYRLGRVGRFRLNRKFRTNRPEDEQTLHHTDLVNAIKYLIALRGPASAARGKKGKAAPFGGQVSVDDIDHLGNRRIRTIAELAADELRKGFLKLRRTAQERMNIEDADTVSPRSVINSKTISSAIDYFFGRGELSQVVDQTNPLSQLKHERGLSALGPGGLNRKRAGFEVRDVHISHYGRICPIETPEGTNIGLISSLAIYSGVDEYGFLVTPYHVVRDGKVTEEIVHLRADEELDRILAPADTELEKDGRIRDAQILGRKNDDFLVVDAKEVDYMDVSPMQLVGVSAALIPFLEHDDANRALMGSNMQRQAVPLLRTDPPIVGTGMERIVARNSSMVVRAEEDGVVQYVDAKRVVISGHEYHLRKFVGLNERTCQNQRPVVDLGEKIAKGQIIADGAATHHGELALGRNVLVAFMPWDGYNYEDAILVSEGLVREDAYTSIHIDMYEIEIRETKLGREEFTNDIPNVSERALRNLDEEGIVRIGTRVRPGDILVGKVAPKSKSELSPEEKLLHAIFGRAGEDVKNDSLTVPPGVEGIIIDTRKFSRKVNISDEERAENHERIRAAEREFQDIFKGRLESFIEAMGRMLGRKLVDPVTRKPFSVEDVAVLPELREVRDRIATAVRGAGLRPDDPFHEVARQHFREIEDAEAVKNKTVNRLSRGDELPTGVLEVVKVYMATRRNLSVGDKMAGRHGNKGVISRILPIEDMPFLEDGTPCELVLNPLGVPSRMNVGQILETHLGYAARLLGCRVTTSVFDGATEDDIEAMLLEAGLPPDGKVTLYDGRTGLPFDQKVTVGYLYMLKLHHLVDEKIHARATGPYSLITQQPLGGKARFGGQRFGEMEVWALEAYGAASILQELLTVKSDDVDGRMKIYESMVKGENILEAGTPVSFEVLCNEIRGLGLNIELEKSRL